MPERPSFNPEAEAERGRTLEGREREKELEGMREFVAGLEAMLADPDFPDEDKAELQEELDELRDSLEAFEAGGDFKVGV